VAHGIGLLPVSDLDLLLGDERPGNRGPHQVGTLVDGIGPQHGKHEVPGELLPQILDVALAGARADRLLLEAVQLFLLPHVGGEGDDLAAGIGFQQPLDDDRRIQSARIGDNHFFYRVRHCLFLLFLTFKPSYPLPAHGRQNRLMDRT
jgi:hypothetical protein